MLRHCTDGGGEVAPKGCGTPVRLAARQMAGGGPNSDAVQKMRHGDWWTSTCPYMQDWRKWSPGGRCCCFCPSGEVRLATAAARLLGGFDLRHSASRLRHFTNNLTHSPFLHHTEHRLLPKYCPGDDGHFHEVVASRFFWLSIWNASPPARQTNLGRAWLQETTMQHCGTVDLDSQHKLSWSLVMEH